MLRKRWILSEFFNWNPCSLFRSTDPLSSNLISFSDINALLAPANVQLAHENAWCAYKDGQGFVASRSHWPGVTKDMITWWFWWHSKESARYSLWHPWAHKSISSTYADKFDDPSLNNTEKLLGSVHHITEIIGSDEQTIDIHWKRPSFFGIDE